MADPARRSAPDFSAGAFRALARARLPALLGAAVGDFQFNPGHTDLFMQPAPRPAAVLVPVVARTPEATLLFTRRTDHLADHAGQVAFPGGRIDPGDDSPEAAALRETREEIGLDPRDIDVFARAPDYLTGSGFLITPVLGEVRPDHSLRINPNEVIEAFEVPLSFLMDPANHAVGSRIWRGIRRFYYEMPYEGRQIWGITAGIVRVLYEELYGERP